MDINVNVTIELAQPMQELIKRVFSGFAFLEPKQEQPQVLPVEQQTVSNEVEMASTEAGSTEVAKAKQPSETVDISVVRDKVSELVRAGKKQQVIELLNDYGVTGYSQLSGNDLAEFYNTIKTM